MLRIGEFSKLSSISIRMLRHYDEMDLLKPEMIDDSSNYRYYVSSQLATASKISKLKELGFSLSIIKEMIHGTDMKKMEDFFGLRKQELEEEMSLLSKQSRLLAQASMILDKKESLDQYHVVLKSIPKRMVISLRTRIATFNDEKEVWEDLYSEFMKQGSKYAKDAVGMTFYHDKEYKSEDIDIEVQSDVDKLYKDTEKVKFFEAPSLQVASVTFDGSYEQMPQVSLAIAEWMEFHDYEMNGPMVIMFHVSSAHSDNPNNWISEACYQVKKKEVK